MGDELVSQHGFSVTYITSHAQSPNCCVCSAGPSMHARAPHFPHTKQSRLKWHSDPTAPPAIILLRRWCNDLVNKTKRDASSARSTRMQPFQKVCLYEQKCLCRFGNRGRVWGFRLQPAHGCPLAHSCPPDVGAWSTRCAEALNTPGRHPCALLLTCQRPTALSKLSTSLPPCAQDMLVSRARHAAAGVVLASSDVVMQRLDNAGIDISKAKLISGHQGQSD